MILTVTPATMAIARSPQRRRSGLSLIEVLLALGIFLMALVAIARLVDMGSDHELEAQMQIRGARLAQSKLAEVTSGFLPLTPASGTFDPTDADWSWTMTAELQGPPNLYLVTVTVNRDMKGRQIQIVVPQLVIDPLMMGSAAPATRAAASTTSTTGGSTTGGSTTGGSTTSGGMP